MGSDLPCPNPMTIIWLPNGGMWLHSPVACVPELVAPVEAFGPVAAIIAPHVFHYIRLADWARAFPQARIFGLPGLASKVPDIVFVALDQPPTASWAGSIDSHVVALGSFAEVVFLPCFFALGFADPGLL